MTAAAISHILQRGKFTDALFAYLVGKTPGPTIWGDGEAPVGGGWSSSQAGAGTFTPYVVLLTGPGQPNLPETLARRIGASWRLVYSIHGVGGDRHQAEYALDTVRPILSALHSQTYNVGVGNEPWFVQKSAYLQLGSVLRNDTVDPPYYEGTDTLEIWLERH